VPFEEKFLEVCVEYLSDYPLFDAVYVISENIDRGQFSHLAPPCFVFRYPLQRPN